METIDISLFFGSLALVASLVTIVTGYINTKTNANTTIKQITAWAVSLAVCFVGSFMHLGIFADMTIINTALNGIAIGLVSNGIFDLEFVQSLLTFIGAKKKKA